jgi:TonB family protein
VPALTARAGQCFNGQHVFRCCSPQRAIAAGAAADKKRETQPLQKPRQPQKFLSFLASFQHAMFLLPTFQAILQPCAVGPEAFRAHAQGHFCDSCQRVVQDFSQSVNPMADLAAARAAAPDGRVCGSFRAAQVQQTPPTLTRRLKWFLVALVMVVGQGLTAHEALAQVEGKAASVYRSTSTQPRYEPVTKQVITTTADSLSTDSMQPEYVWGGIMPISSFARKREAALDASSASSLASAGKKLSFRGGGMPQLVAFIQKNLRRPTAEDIYFIGVAYVEFVVNETGQVRDVTLLRGVSPDNLTAPFDKEALRLIRSLTGFVRINKAGRAAPVRLVVPVRFN